MVSGCHEHASTSLTSDTLHLTLTSTLPSTTGYSEAKVLRLWLLIFEVPDSCEIQVAAKSFDLF